MGAQQNLAAFHRMWDAYATGRTRTMLDELAADAEWRPLGSGTEVRGHDAILRWTEAVGRRYRSVTVVFADVWTAGEACVAATADVRMFDGQGRCVVDTGVGWVCEFGDDGLVRRMTACGSHAETRELATRSVPLSAQG